MIVALRSLLLDRNWRSLIVKTLASHVIVGSGSVILPGVTLEEGVAVGALSVIRRNCAAFGIYSGNPARRVAERRQDLLALAVRLTQAAASPP